MRKALGRGLDALIPKAPPAEVGGKPSGQEIRRIAVADIRPNRLQPRKNFDPERLSELSQSIKEHGLAQPIVVSFDKEKNQYELIAGERRLRASQLAGITHIDAIVKSGVDDRRRLALALVENIQRDDLNAIEKAVSYKRLMEEFAINSTQLSQVLGKSKPAISNTLRLLDLPVEMQKAVQFEQISEGHARALLMVADPEQRRRLFLLAVQQKLSVRDVESLAQAVAKGKKLPDLSTKNEVQRLPKTKPADIRALEQQLAHSLGTKVEIRTGKDAKRGRLILHFYTLSDFDKILKMLKK